MLKFTETDITFKEVPGKICRCFSVSNCGLHCKNCHSPELQGDNGEELTPEKLLNFIKQDKRVVDCYVFLGEGNDIEALKRLLIICKNNGLETCIYSGKSNAWQFINDYLHLLDYIKVGPYIEELGGLDNQNTNKKFFNIIWGKDNAELVDETYKFWKK